MATSETFTGRPRRRARPRRSPAAGRPPPAARQASRRGPALTSASPAAWSRSFTGSARARPSGAGHPDRHRALALDEGRHRHLPGVPLGAGREGGPGEGVGKEPPVGVGDGHLHRARGRSPGRPRGAPAGPRRPAARAPVSATTTSTGWPTRSGAASSWVSVVSRTSSRFASTATTTCPAATAIPVPSGTRVTTPANGALRVCFSRFTWVWRSPASAARACAWARSRWASAWTACDSEIDSWARSRRERS